MERDIEKQLKVILQGTEDVLLLDELKEKLRESIDKKKPLRVKLGLDPTAPDIHLGHTVVLNKLRQFQDLGHKAILIIGDYTARIGDPSGRSTIRPRLSAGEIKENAKTYMEQAFKILDPERTEIVENSRWLGSLKLEDILSLTSKFTVARMLEREDFKKRFQGNIPITLMEFLYPIMQAYDSVAIKADVELGGTDQRFNLLMGRELQKEFSQPPQTAITMPILVGIDGVEKMSKSLGNYIGVTEPPEEIFGKIMSIPDNIMIDYYKLLTRLSNEEIKKIECEIKEGKLNPSIAKRNLAKIIIENLYNKDDAEKAEQTFNRIFKQKKAPDEVKECVLSGKDIKDGKIWIVKLLVDSGLADSNSQARRLIEQGAVKVGEDKIENPNLELNIEDIDQKIIQKGKRHFRKILIQR
ncbi:MAG: tyrosine--tRNA ligase [Actinobacteria bacterium]|nr:tyrosine--tRNA ligase [Actinomycetota bacterium]